VLLVRASVRNRLRRQLGRMRKPRYVIALLIGVAYFAFIFSPDRPRTASEVGLGAGAEVMGPLLVAAYLAWSWLWGGYRYALAFTPAEVQHLFTAPVTRRTLIHYKLLRSQLGLLFTIVLFTWIMDDVAQLWYLRLFSLWLLFTTMQLHQVAASLVHASAESQGVTGARRNAIPIVLFLAAMGVLAWSLVNGLPAIRAAARAGELAEALRDLMNRPAATIVLFPARLLLAPLYAADSASWVRALPGAVSLLILHYLWVVRTDAAFEEGAAEIGARRAARVAALRAGKRPPRFTMTRQRRLLFPLRPPGRPERALLWKNLVAFVRGLRQNTVFLVLVAVPMAIAAVLVGAESGERAATGIATGAIMLAAMVLVLGPLGIRNDLRQDLARIALLRTYPLRGRGIIGAEVASAAVVLTVAEMVLLLVAVIAFTYATPDAALAYALVYLLGVLVLPSLNALALVVQNGLALFFPEWMRVGAEGAGGIEFMGQHILRIVGSILLILAGLIPPALVGAAIAARLFPAIGARAAIPAAVAFIPALWIEVALVVLWLGDVFERTDPAEAGLAR
jgi:hypothetical protein